MHLLYVWGCISGSPTVWHLKPEDPVSGYQLWLYNSVCERSCIMPRCFGALSSWRQLLSWHQPSIFGWTLKLHNDCRKAALQRCSCLLGGEGLIKDANELHYGNCTIFCFSVLVSVSAALLKFWDFFLVYLYLTNPPTKKILYPRVSPGEQTSRVFFYAAPS